MARVSIRVDGFEEGDMERGRDMVVSRKLQLVSDLINYFKNLKRAYIPWTELPAR